MKILPLLALLPLSLATPLPASAQDGAEGCTAIADARERLACYDAAFGVVAPAGADVQTAVWRSEQLIPARPSGRQPATVTVTCDMGNLSIAFGFAGNTLSALGNDAGITLQYDLQAARSRTLPVNDANTALVIGATSDAEAFLQGLEGVTNLTVRVTPVNSRSLSVRFRVDTFASAVEPVRAACAG